MATIAPTTTIGVHLSYWVLSPSGRTQWLRSAGPFMTEADARTHLAALDGVIGYRIEEKTLTTRVIEDRPAKKASGK